MNESNPLLLAVLALAALAALLAISCALLWAAAALFNRLEQRRTPWRAAEAPPLPRPGAEAPPTSRVGRAGRALTPLRPVGVIELDGERREAEAIGGFVPAGAEVIVAEQRGEALRVRVRG